MGREETLGLCTYLPARAVRAATNICHLRADCDEFCRPQSNERAFTTHVSSTAREVAPRCVAAQRLPYQIPNNGSAIHGGQIAAQASPFSIYIVAQSHFGLTGAAISIGEQPVKVLVNPSAGARMAVGEALTNMA